MPIFIIKIDLNEKGLHFEDFIIGDSNLRMIPGLFDQMRYESRINYPFRSIHGALKLASINWPF